METQQQNLIKFTLELEGLTITFFMRYWDFFMMPMLADDSLTF